MPDQAHAFSFVLLACLAGFGAWTDATRRHLSNGLVLATLAAGLGVAAVEGAPGQFMSHLGHFAIALAIGLALFAAGVWGGGDGKFYAAVSVWFPVSSFFSLVFAISMVGFVMLLVMMAKSRGRLLRKDTKGVPYGIAIGLGALVAFGQGLW